MIFQDRRETTVAFGCAAALILIWISLYNIRGPGLFYEPQPSLELQEGEDSVFLRHAMNVEFPAPIDYTPIHSVCTQSPNNFRPGLLFSCEEQHGGVGMVRNQILKCIRYAIHGGGSLVIPSMAKRNPKDISDIETSNEVSLEYLFDRSAFIEHLTASCPGMRLYNHASDFPAYENRARKNRPLQLAGDQFEPNHPRTGLSDPWSWRESFENWVREQDVEITPEEPVHVRIGQAYLEYPVHNDSLSFASEFGKILSFRADTRALAAQVLLALDQRFELGIDPERPINEKSFFGAHLRLEKDAVEAWSPEEGWRFSRMEDQFKEVWGEIRGSGMEVVYVACGDQSIVDKFSKYIATTIKEEGKEMNISVVTKYTLLGGHDLARLNALTFDQQALVDFLIMFKAGFFMGVAHSSFPWTVALRRHELSVFRAMEGEEKEDGGFANLGSDLLRDELSVIMGMRRDYPYVDPFEWGLWP